MTIAPLGTTASGGVGGSPPSTLLAAPGCCGGGALDVRNQEKAANSECPAGPRRQEPEVPVVALALPPPPPPPPHPRIQEPVKPKRRRDVDGAEVIWVFKKQRSAVAAARGRCDVNWAAAAAPASSPIVQELAGKMDGVECIGKKGHDSPGRNAGEAQDERMEGNARPCNFAAPLHGLDGMRQDSEVTVLDPASALPVWSVQKPVKQDHQQIGEEVCWLIKKSCRAAVVAACMGGNGADGQANPAAPSTPSPGIQEPVSRCSPVQKAKPAGRRKTTSSSDNKTTEQPFMSLSSGLRCLGVTNVTPVLAKTLTSTDSRLDQARLQVSSREFVDSPLMGMLTPDEYAGVHTKDGLPLEALDRHGCSYDMRFGFVRLQTCIAYRLKKGWTKFLARSGVREGDLVELGAFRVQGRLMLTLLNYAKDGWIPEELEAADGSLMLSDFKDGTKS